MTGVGVILGTAAYMAPEQARGKAVDKRADIWAFGCVLYEMLTGRRAFQGDDVADTLGSVLKVEPKWEHVSHDVSPGIRAVLRACLQKNPKQRLADVQDMRLALDGVFEVPTVTSEAPPQWRSSLPWAVAATMGLMAITAVLWSSASGSSDDASNVVRFEVTMPPDHDLFLGGGASLALTPDGQSLIYIGVSERGRALYRRRLAELESVVIPGSEAASVVHPAVSPDGTRVAFHRDSRLAILDLAGGTARDVSDLRAYMGVAWQDDQTLIDTERADNLRIVRLPASGSTIEVLLAGDGPADTGYNYPSVHPNGSVLAYSIWGGSVENAEIAVRDLDSGVDRVLMAGSSPTFTTSDHLLFVRDAALWAVPFDADRLEAESDPVRVVDNVQTNSGGLGLFAVSPTGTLAYVPGGLGSRRLLVAVDAQGVEEDLGLPTREYEALRVSPDGSRAAVVIRDPTTRRGAVWVWEFARASLIELAGAADVDYGGPIWSPDDRQVVYSAFQDGGARCSCGRSTARGRRNRSVRESPSNFWTPRRCSCETWAPEGCPDTRRWAWRPARGA
jgi:serine/threonine-protein kinase